MLACGDDCCRNETVTLLAVSRPTTDALNSSAPCLRLCATFLVSRSLSCWLLVAAVVVTSGRGRSRWCVCKLSSSALTLTHGHKSQVTAAGFGFGPRSGRRVWCLRLLTVRAGQRYSRAVHATFNDEPRKLHVKQKCTKRSPIPAQSTANL